MILSQPKEEAKVPLPGLIGKGAFAAKDSEPEVPVSPKVKEAIEEEVDDEPEPEDVEGTETEEEEEETEDEAQEEIEQANS
jgi:hypothetical protein